MNANTCLAPTVKPGFAYITIDTACENTVGGYTHLELVARILQEKYDVKPLEYPEQEPYRFGPGEPRVSKERWHIPIGIGGKTMVIKTSSLEDRGKDQNKIPWLAGQDWLRFVEAVVDIADHKIFMKALDAEAELFIDHTGHLVVAVDDFPSGGWPQGKTATRDDYAGVLWLTGKAYTESAEVKFTHVYNPEDDPYSTGDVVQRAPCSVPPDAWNSLEGHPLVYIRNHMRPRSARFHPDEVTDGPESRELQPLRIGPEDGPWTGFTVFFRVDCDPKTRLDALPQPCRQQGVVAVFAEHGQLVVHPRSLQATIPKRVVRSLDLTIKPPELPMNRQQKIFTPSAQKILVLSAVFIKMRKSPKPQRDLALSRWRQLVASMMTWYYTMEQWVVKTKVIRELKHRAPALMGYMEAMLQKEVQLMQDLPPALPSASTLAKRQTPLSLNMAYQMEPPQCPHLVELGRRYGNAHGKFLECIACGSVWKGLDYILPISSGMVTTQRSTWGFETNQEAR